MRRKNASKTDIWKESNNKFNLSHVCYEQTLIFPGAAMGRKHGPEGGGQGMKY